MDMKIYSNIYVSIIETSFAVFPCHLSTPIPVRSASVSPCQFSAVSK